MFSLELNGNDHCHKFPPGSIKTSLEYANYYSQFDFTFHFRNLNKIFYILRLEVNSDYHCHTILRLETYGLSKSNHKCL